MKAKYVEELLMSILTEITTFTDEVARQGALMTFAQIADYLIYDIDEEKKEKGE